MYRLPGSTDTTTSERVYLREWHKVIKPLERLTGFQVTAYDPGLNLCQLRKLPDGKTTAYDYSLQIPVEFARAILEGVKKATSFWCLAYPVILSGILSGLLSGCATCQFKPKLVEPTPDRPAQVQLWTW
jgi:hypothetical protein